MNPQPAEEEFLNCFEMQSFYVNNSLYVCVSLDLVNGYFTGCRTCGGSSDYMLSCGHVNVPILTLFGQHRGRSRMKSLFTPPAFNFEHIASVKKWLQVQLSGSDVADVRRP